VFLGIFQQIALAPDRCITFSKGVFNKKNTFLNRYDIYIYIFIYLTAIGLTPGGSSTSHTQMTPGGSSTLHIYTHSTHNTENGKLGSAGRAPSLKEP
jgi:hypothetical protein